MITLLSNQEFDALYKNESSILIDVRERDEFNEAHLEGALNLPLLENFEESVNKALHDNHAMLYVYCRSGKRSNSACEILRRMGYSNCLNIGGIINYQSRLIK